MIKLFTAMAGDTFSYSAGAIVTLDAGTEQRLIDSGQAEKVATKATKAQPKATPKAKKNAKK